MIKHYLTGVIVNAHAKLNISLCVDGKMSDNFHQIRSLICPISLSDSIEIEVFKAEVKAVEITTEADPELNLTEQEFQILNSNKNLAYRAAELMLSEQEDPYLIKIKITKKIPTKAGLGGGSTNAASVLLALSKIFYPTNQINPKLIEIASFLGSDVVSQLFGKLIFAYGRGEKFSEVELHPESDFIEFLKSLKIILLKPKIGVDTSRAYGLLGKQSINDPNLKIEIAKNNNFETAGLSVLGSKFKSDFKIKASSLDLFCNDFETSIRDNFPDVDLAFKELSLAGAEKVMLAGSGSCVFGLFRQGTANITANLKSKLGNEWFVKQSHFLGL